MNTKTEPELLGLPPHLSERTRLAQKGTTSAGGYVVYWMRAAVRTNENPALDVAIFEANRLKLPLVVYHALSQHYWFASDRHHVFMLEGARDVQAEFANQGIRYVFHLATRDDSKPYLIDMAAQAALVVTEDMPVDPPRRFLRTLFGRVDARILCVDTACVVPMKLVKKAHTRAFQFRNATWHLYQERLCRVWPHQDDTVRDYDVSSVPFEPIDLEVADLTNLVARCEIDHSVAPVVDTHGGTLAGYARWNSFKQKGLSQYARRRNNALVDGVSRMSAYLHYGMVSPMRIAREAYEYGNAGSEKYLDELLIWRELAYAFCFYREDHDQISAIPEWARKTLASHQSDRRPQIYSWEQLARAQTDDELWNAAQSSLLVNGELHNNVRMTWGKSILKWTRSLDQALQLMIDLNHRYALDGRDPASYGGLLWCLGQFDRPFNPPSNIFGTVRPRSTTDHAKRLDVSIWKPQVSSSRLTQIPKVAVVGAGISGLFAARTLQDHGLSVTVFDKGRGVGGRMSTRRLDGLPVFDHGAQYFTARDRRFKKYVDSWLEQGVVGRWPDVSNEKQKTVSFKNGIQTPVDSKHERYVGAPSMSTVCKHLAVNLDVRLSVKVAEVERRNKMIVLNDTDGQSLGRFDRLIVSAPAPQTVELLRNFRSLRLPASKIRMNPCWATMVTFREPIADDWSGARIQDSVLSWASRNSTKPGRNDTCEHLVLHANHQWSIANQNLHVGKVASQMLDAFWQCSGINAVQPVDISTHFWRFAIPINPSIPTERCYFDNQMGIAACGDWVSGPRVEDAFLSGMAAAGRLLTAAGTCLQPARA